MINRLVLTALSILLLLNNANAQLFKRMHAKQNEPAPKAILIQLYTYQNRAAQLEKQGNDRLLETLKRDRDSIIKNMVNDFNDNFSYCPKYYYYDTNYKKILNKDFDGVLLNKDLKPANNIVINNTDDNYFIVSFGNNITSNKSSVSASSKHKLVVCDSKLNRLERPLPDGTNNVWPGKIGYQLAIYNYESSNFDISYRPYAAHFNAKLLHFYGIYPYKN